MGCSGLTGPQIASIVFTLAIVVVLPFYTIMVLAPNAELTKKSIESGIPYVVLGLVYASLGYAKKHTLFIKWKYLEAKAAAYYYNGLILDKGNEPSCHITSACCFLAAEELLADSKKACLSFCLAAPVTRAPPLWGAMKHLNKNIPGTASRKSQMYGYLLDKEK